MDPLNPITAKLLIKASGGGNLFAKMYMISLGCDIYCRLPKTTKIGHPYGIIIHSMATIGKNCTIMHQVTIGEKEQGGKCPQIGNNVFNGAGAKILGKVTIGDNVIVGANAVVTKNIQDGMTVIGVNRILTKRTSNDIK